MTQKPKESELEKVKTLLRRLEELPQDAMSEQVPPAAGVVRLSTSPEAPLRPRPVLVEPKRAAPEPPAFQPPPRQTLSADAPMAEAEQRGNGRRFLIAGAFAVACAAGFVLARPWDNSQSAPAMQRTAMKAPPLVTAPSPSSATRQAEVRPVPGLPVVPAGSSETAQREPAAEAQEPPASAGAASAPPMRAAPAETAAAPREASERGNVLSAPAPLAPAAAPAPPAASPQASVAPSPRVPMPDAESPDEELMRSLVKQGSQMLLQGQVASARLLFRRAADLGSADAALQLGDTFDPERLRALGARGVAGDLQEAIRWYEKADELGASSAKARLMALSSR